MRTLIALALAATLASPAAFAFEATVVACHDGDTCTLASGVRVRLHAIDAPELDQPGGEQARALINQLVAGQRVDVRPTGDTSHHRMVADIRLPHGSDVAAIMVNEGAAWVEARGNTDPVMPARQAVAKRRHIGLLANSIAIQPWTWRHMHRLPA